MSVQGQRLVRLPPEVNRILFVKNLPFKMEAEELYDIFGKYGAVRQIRRGNANDTRGTAFVVYEDIFDAKNALESLQGFNVKGRYIVVLYHQTTRLTSSAAIQKRTEKLEQIKQVYNLHEDAQ